MSVSTLTVDIERTSSHLSVLGGHSEIQRLRNNAKCYSALAAILHPLSVGLS